jgi:hypothetical protein
VLQRRVGQGEACPQTGRDVHYLGFELRAPVHLQDRAETLLCEAQRQFDVLRRAVTGQLQSLTVIAHRRSVAAVQDRALFGDGVDPQRRGRLIACRRLLGGVVHALQQVAAQGLRRRSRAQGLQGRFVAGQCLLLEPVGPSVLAMLCHQSRALLGRLLLQLAQFRSQRLQGLGVEHPFDQAPLGHHADGGPLDAVTAPGGIDEPLAATPPLRQSVFALALVPRLLKHITPVQVLRVDPQRHRLFGVGPLPGG